MRKKYLALALRVPHALQVAQYHKEQAEVREIADRLARDASLSLHDRVVAVAALRDYVRIRKPPPKPRGAKPKFDLLTVEDGYRCLLKSGHRATDAVGILADKFSVSEPAIRAALRQGTFSSG